MKNLIHQVIAALDAAKNIRLLSIMVEDKVVRFITDESAGVPLALPRPDIEDSVQDWFAKNGIGTGERDPQGQEAPRQR